MKEISSQNKPEASGEIDPNKLKNESLEHLERPEGSKTTPEEKREARILKYQEMLSAKEAELHELSPEYISSRAAAAFDKAIENGQDADMAGRLRDATRKTLEEKAASLSTFIEEIKSNIAKLEAGQDNLYSSQ